MADNPFILWIKKRLTEQNKNVLMVFHGDTGNGKSSSAIKLAELYDPNFNIDRIVFTPEGFMKAVNELPNGSTIIWDEAGVGVPRDKWYSVSNKIINYVVQTFRTKNFLVIFTTPALKYIDSKILIRFNVQAEAMGIDFTIKRSKCWLLKTVYSSRNDKMYYYTFQDENGVKINPFYFGKPSDKLWKQYEKKRKIFTDGLNRQSQVKLKELEIQNKKKESIMSDDEILKMVKKNKQRYLNRIGNISYQLIAGDFNIGRPRATKIKALIDRESK